MVDRTFVNYVVFELHKLACVHKKPIILRTGLECAPSTPTPTHPPARLAACCARSRAGRPPATPLRRPPPLTPPHPLYYSHPADLPAPPPPVPFTAHTPNQLAGPFTEREKKLNDSYLYLRAPADRIPVYLH